MTSLIILFLITSFTIVNIEPTSNTICDGLKSMIEKFMSPQIVVIYYNESEIYDWVFDLFKSIYLINPSAQKPVDFSTYVYSGSENYIVFVDNLKALKTAFNFLEKFTTINNRGKILINYQISVKMREIHNTFHYLWRKNLYKTIIHTIEDEFMAWYPYKPESKCGKTVYISPINCNHPFGQRIPWNFNQCPFTISWNMYAIFMWDPFNNTYPGVLFIALNTIAKLLNFQPVYLKENSDFLIEFLETNSFDLAKKDVEKRNIDLILYGTDNGLQIELDNLQDIVKSVSYNFLVPSTNKLPLNFYFNMFDGLLIIATLSALVLIVILWRIIAPESYLMSIFTVYRVLFQLNLPNLKKQNSLRLLFIALILFVFFINIKYNSHLSSVLTSPGTVKKLRAVNQIELLNSDEKIDKNLSRYLFFTGLNETLGRTSDNLLAVVQNDIRPDYHLQDFLDNGSHVNKWHMMHFQDFEDNLERLQISSKERITGIDYKIASRRGLHLNEKLNYWIETIWQTGLLEKWTDDQSILLKKIIIEDPGILSPVQLGLIHLQGAFTILFIGLALAFITFIIEIILFKNGYFRYYLK